MVQALPGFLLFTLLLPLLIWLNIPKKLQRDSSPLNCSASQRQKTAGIPHPTLTDQ